MGFVKKYLKDIIYITLIAILFALVISLFCIKVDGNKIAHNNWVSVYGFTLENGTIYKILSEEEYYKHNEMYWSQYSITHKAKEIKLKRSEAIINVKFIGYDGEVLEDSYSWYSISRIEYL